MKKSRVYFVIDMKSFFASVECAERGLDAMTTNLVVADSDRTSKTICLAVSPSLKKLGIKNRCRLYEIPKSINFVIAKPRMQKYIEYASNIYAIYLKYISKDDIHVYSIDECFIDVTDYLSLYNMRAKQFALMLMNEINSTLGIPSTTGIGSNMYLAKIALDITAKSAEDRIGWLTEDKFIKELWHHTPITDFWQISTGIQKRLSKLGIVDMYGIAHCNEDKLYNELGINAELLIDHSWGRETCLMEDIKAYKGKSKSISNSQILPCGYSYDKARIVVQEMIQEGCYRLSSDNVVTSLIHLSLSYEGDKDKEDKGTKRLNVVTNVFSILGKEALKLFDSIVDKNKLVRKITYDFSELLPKEYEKYDFFTDVKKVEKEKVLTNEVLDIKNKFGKNAILKLIDLKQGATQKERNKMIGGHNSGED
jgi:DNA polymerase V